MATPAPSNLGFVEELYATWLVDPGAVGDDWRAYFSGQSPPAPPPVQMASTAHAAAHLPPPPTPELARRIPFLRSLPLFTGVPEEELLLLAGVAEELVLGDGEHLFRQGEPGRDVFIIELGAVLIRRGGRVLAALGPGEVVGELAALDEHPRSADAVAKGTIRLLRLRAQDVVRLLDERPLLARGILRVLTKRLRETSARQDQVDQLIRAYRVRGHLLAHLSPLAPPRESHPELDPAYYGFTPEDQEQLFSSATIPGSSGMTLREILALLRNTYCRSIGVQFMHIDDPEVKDWLQARMEGSQNTRGLSREEQLRILTKLTDAEIFEQFIHAKFQGAKRFSLEGGETLIPLLDMAIDEAAAKGVKEVVLGMAHRGRLNVLANILGKSPQQIFHEFDDAHRDRHRGAGDVKYHLGYSTDRLTPSGHPIHLSLCFNPSHLEFVGPVVLGRVRAKQDHFRDRERTAGLGIVIHGDAAFAGQGVVQEILNMSQLAGYRTGGTLHVILNNQIGFTTDPADSRSTHYATDVARMLQIPVFHVNGEHPEPVAQVIRLAMDFRERFHRDVVIDMYCYRRHGHNEGDEPAFTQPLLYERVRRRKSVREGYVESLLKLGGVSQAEANEIAVRRKAELEHDLERARSPEFVTMDLTGGQGLWRTYHGGDNLVAPEVDTRVPATILAEALRKLAQLPGGEQPFTPHPKIQRLLAARLAMADGKERLDWAHAEALAFASILEEGVSIRLSGQDSERGTFSQRHSVLHDVKTGRRHTPLNHLAPGQGRLEVVNSPLSEVGVLGFEYGYSLDAPDTLVLWEAQFGDFANVAQVIIDQFLAAGEAKWRRLSGLVLLLPHGFEGQGPEHSSARVERFLQLAAEDNLQIMNLSTPAQLFHALRRQVRRPLRKPLVLLTPKSLLRHPRATSTLEELAEGSFQTVLADSNPPPEGVRRILLTSGKLYYELLEAREKKKRSDVAILRLEQYYPLDQARLLALLAPYPRRIPLVWVQEEPENMGAWSFLSRALPPEVAERYTLTAACRPPSASPATGSGSTHRQEQQELLERAFL